MKRTWLNKKLTFLVIPEAHRSVLQFKIPNPILLFIPLLTLTLVSTLVILYMLHVDSLDFNQKMQLQLSEQEIEFEQSLSAKEQTIESLQNDVITLSHQAEEVKSKVEELKKLENEIKGITEPVAVQDKPVQISSFEGYSEIEPVRKKAIGGSLVPAQNSDISKLASSTESDFSHLDDEMDLLFDNLSLAKDEILEYQELMRITPTLWPTVSKRVTSNFGYRSDPFTRKPSLHAGIDIGGKVNSPIYSTADGIVLTAGYDRAAGNHIIINHSNGIRTIYMHLNKLLVQKDDTIKKGQEIGKLGSTGRSTGPHLHYEVLKNGTQIDPRPYMQSTRKDED